MNADGKHGFWQYWMVKDVADIPAVLAVALASIGLSYAQHSMV